MDDTYQVYVNRVARMTLPDAYQTQIRNIQASPKFHAEADGTLQAVPFPGYSVITPTWDDETGNDAFYQQVKACQDQVIQGFSANQFAPVPASSYHLTLADLIWNSGYKQASADPEFDQHLRDRIAKSFEIYRARHPQPAPIVWQVMGLMVRTRAIGLCLVPKSEASYAKVLDLRRAIYQNSGLMALGIEQQYHLTAHITLGYFGEITDGAALDSLSSYLSELNQRWQDNDEAPEFVIDRAELRKFDNMTYYYCDPSWPVVEL